MQHWTGGHGGSNARENVDFPHPPIPYAPESPLDNLASAQGRALQAVVVVGMGGGALSAVQLFGLLAVVETHTLWYFGHHCCLVVGFDAMGI